VTFSPHFINHYGLSTSCLLFSAKKHQIQRRARLLLANPLGRPFCGRHGVGGRQSRCQRVPGERTDGNRRSVGRGRFQRRGPFYADSAPSAGKFLNLLDRRGWDWSVRYNKWTSKLDTIAAQMKEEEWSAPEEGWTGRESPSSSNTDGSNTCPERVGGACFCKTIIPSASAGGRQTGPGRLRCKPSGRLGRAQIGGRGDQIGTKRGAGKAAHGGALSTVGSESTKCGQIRNARQLFKPHRDENRPSASRNGADASSARAKTGSHVFAASMFRIRDKVIINATP